MLDSHDWLGSSFSQQLNLIHVICGRPVYEKLETQEDFKLKTRYFSYLISLISLIFKKIKIDKQYQLWLWVE